MICPTSHIGHSAMTYTRILGWRILLSLAGVFLFAGDRLEAQQIAGEEWGAAYAALTIENGELAGPGRERFVEQCGDCRYILFGEQHGIAGLAEIVAAAHQTLNDRGFHRLVVERGDWYSTLLAGEPSIDVLERYPHSFAFDFDGDIELVQQVEQLAGASSHRVIGIDQEANAIHPFHYIGSHADSWRARRLARGLHLKALLRGGRYINTDYFGDLERLEALAEGDQRSLDVIKSVRDSMEIFLDHAAGNYADSVSGREQRMMSEFDAAIDEIARNDESAGSFVFKMGGAHIVRGIGPNGVETLGEHVAKRAAREGMRSFHVGIHSWTEETVLPLPDELAGNSFVYVDTGKLLEILENEQRETISLTSELRMRLEHYDAYILIPNAEPASRETMAAFESAFRRNALTGVGVLLIPILILLVYSWRFAASRRMHRANSETIQKIWLWALPALIAFQLMLVIVFQLYLLVKKPAAAGAGSAQSVWGVDVLVVLATALTIWAIFRSRMEDWWSASDRKTFAIGVVACVALAAYMNYWGLGTMLGV